MTSTILVKLGWVKFEFINTLNWLKNILNSSTIYTYLLLRPYVNILKLIPFKIQL